MTRKAKETNPKTHFVAIVRMVEHYYNYGDDYSIFAQAISDWEEVDEETFQLLKNASMYRTSDYNFIVLERLSVNSPVVVNTVSAYVKHLEKQKADQEAAKAEREAKAEQRRLAKLAKDEKSRRQLYETLQKEFEKDTK